MTIPGTATPAAAADDSGMIPAPPPSSDAQNWRIARELLLERIRRRRLALAQLRHEEYDAGALQAQLTAIGDDARSLWRLADDLDRTLDMAFAPRARRIPANDPKTPAPAKSHADEFRVR